ncbi:hypothetical protein BJ085DRAFT_37885, partial [Dimargaris cristalligena]
MDPAILVKTGGARPLPVSPHSGSVGHGAWLATVGQLDEDLRAQHSQLGAIHKDTQALRLRLREHYSDMLFRDLVFAHARDLETALWKTCFYR